MCGISGYVGNKRASGILLKSIKKLEYRGYDSVGMATVSDGKILVKKDKGKIEEVDKKLNFSELPGSVGVAHTRWATHSGVSKENSHPHTDCKGDIALVHNGIIENFQVLRKEMEDKGHRFSSGTDTEIICHLIEEYAKGVKGKDGFKEATMEALKRLEGNYAIVAVNKDGEMVAARKGSPLVLGVGKGEYFVASDIPAFLEYTKNVIYLYENDFVFLDGGLEIYNLETGERVKRVTDTIGWNAEQARKGVFPHYMLKEIMEQAETVKRATEQDPGIIRRIAKEINEANGVFFVACGSSYHACLSASYTFSRIAGKHINVVLASEFPNYEHFLTGKSMVIAVSQSGETADVLDAVRAAKGKNARVLSIVNVMGSSLIRHSDGFLLMNAGPEICVLSTKTYTSQLALLLLLAYTVAGNYEKGKQELTYAWNLVYNLTSRNTREHIKQLAEKLKGREHIFTIGRGLQYPTALESALKIKEVSYIHAEGFAGGELKHGTIALIEEGTPAIVFVEEKIEREIISNAMEIKARGGYIIGVGPKNNEAFDYFIKVPEVGNANPICQIIPIQLLAYELALLRGCDPDKPKSLAKAVTVR